MSEASYHRDRLDNTNPKYHHKLTDEVEHYKNISMVAESNASIYNNASYNNDNCNNVNMNPKSLELAMSFSEKDGITSLLHDRRATKAVHRFCGCTLIFLGIIILGASFVYGVLVPSFLNKYFVSNQALCTNNQRNESMIFLRNPNGDCDTCRPTYSSFYLFHLHKIHGNALGFQEMGPYTYRKFNKRRNIQFIQSGKQFQYEAYTTYKRHSVCPSCDPNDRIRNPNQGYLQVMTHYGGEKNFVKNLINRMESTEHPMFIQSNNQPLLFFSSMNSSSLQKGILQFMFKLDGLSKTDINSTLTTIQVLSSPTKSNIYKQEHLVGLYENLQEKYNGVFHVRTVEQFLFGNPSFLSGYQMADIFLQCQQVEKNSTTSTMKICESLSPVKALTQAKCVECFQAKQDILKNEKACDIVYDVVKSTTLDKKKAETFVQNTCRRCTLENPSFCVKLIHSYSNGFGPFKNIKKSDKFPLATQSTGCNSYDRIKDFIQYDSKNQMVLGALNNYSFYPTASTLQQFEPSNACEVLKDKAFCQVVSGQDGYTFSPKGVNMKGLRNKLQDADIHIDVYIPEIHQQMIFAREKKVKDTKNIKMIRYRPFKDLLENHTESVQGIQNLAYTHGFLNYISRRFYLYADQSLLSHAELSMRKGVQASVSELYQDGQNVKQEYIDQYDSYIDVEISSGKSLNQRRRWMKSVALTPLNANESISNLMWTELKSQKLMPTHWTDEKFTLSAEEGRNFKLAEGFATAIFWILIFGSIFGLFFLGFGIYLVVRKQRNEDLDYSKH